MYKEEYYNRLVGDCFLIECMCNDTSIAIACVDTRRDLIDSKLRVF